MSAPLGIGMPTRLSRRPLTPRPMPSPPAGRIDDRSYLNKRMLRLVVLARLVVASAGLLLAALGARGAQPIAPWALAGIVVVVAALSGLGLARALGRAPVGRNELLLQILCDIALLTLAFALAGGYEPALDYVFVLPLVFAAGALGVWRTVLVAGLLMAGWGLSERINHPGAGAAVAFEYASHLMVGAVVAYFAHAVARISRLHERLIAGVRERVITALGAEARGMLATRAAHTLSTPLGTMAVVVADLREGRVPPAEHEAALETIASQIAICKLHLSGLLESAGVGRGEHGHRANAVQLLVEMREECLLHYPAAQVTLDVPRHAGAGPEVVIELSLFNALSGLAKDLAREPPHAAHVTASWDERHVTVEVRGSPAPGPDPGPAAAPRRRERIAVLAAIVERHGGRLEVQPGARRITVHLPHVPSNENTD